MRAALVSSVLACVLLGCGDKATGRTYRGEPLFSVAGQLQLRANRTPTGPIHLAVAWYPDQRSAAAPRAIVPQDVEYQGSFPLNYSFAFYGLPPPGAVQPYTQNGHTVGSAWGVLIAYEDLNGNGQLDPIPVGGSAVDRILGTSVGDTYNGNGADERFYVVYLDGPPPPEWAGYSAGYNLWRNNEVVPPTTPVALPLDDTAELSLFVCDEFLSGRGGSSALPCNIAPTGGMRIIGQVYTSSHVPVASVSVTTDGVQPVLGAAVEVNGTRLPYVPELQSYELDGQGLTVHAPGDNEVRVSVDGGAARVFHVTAPADFTLVAPAQGAHVVMGAPVLTQWTAANAAYFYQVGSYVLSPPYTGSEGELIYASTGRLSTSLPGLNADDFHRVYVTAYAREYVVRGLGGSVVTAATSQEATLDAISPDAGVRVEGTLTQLIYQGAVQDSAYVSLFDGVSETQGAVSVNGLNAPLDPQYHVYSVTTGGLFSPGGVGEITGTVPGHAPATQRTQFPGDFAVTPPPDHAPSTQPLTLRWTASALTSGYRFWVTDALGNQLFYGQTLERSGVVPALTVTGDVVFSVAAVGPGGDRHLEATLQRSFDVHLDP